MAKTFVFKHSLLLLVFFSNQITAQLEKADHYTLTKTLSPEEPLYKNPTPGAAHMLKASDGFYYSYDGDAGNWPIRNSEDGLSWERLGTGGEAYPEGTWGEKNFWVPEVVEFNGKHYMFYCAREVAKKPSSRLGIENIFHISMSKIKKKFVLSQD